MSTTSCIVCFLLTATIAICVEPDEVVPEIVPESLLATSTSQDSQDLKKYSLVGKGVARAYSRNSPDYFEGTELWLWQSSSKGHGVQKCFEAVLADTRCSEFFTYVTHGDQNCGCRPKSSAMVTQVVENKGVNCWSACGGKQGPCAWCGTGVCCRSGWPDTSNGCDGTLGIVGSNQHVCVASGDFSTRTDGMSHYFKISTECPTGKSVRGTGSLCLAPPPVLLSMAGGGQAAQMIATGVVAGLSRTGTGIMDRISAVSGNSGGTWIMDGLIASQSFYDRVTSASDDEQVKSLVGSLFSDFKSKVSQQSLDKPAGADAIFAQIMSSVKNIVDMAAKRLGGDSGQCTGDFGRLLYPLVMGIDYGMFFHTFSKNVIQAYYPELRGTNNPTFNGKSSDLRLTAFGERVRATYTTAMAPTTWAYAKDPFIKREWWNQWAVDAAAKLQYTNKIFQTAVARGDAPSEFKEQINAYVKSAVAVPLAFSKAPRGDEKAGWVYSRAIDRLELHLETAYDQPTRLNLPDDPPIDRVTAMSSAAGGGLLSTDTLQPVCPKEILSVVRGNGISVSGIPDDTLFKPFFEQPEWSQQARFIDGGYADNTGFAFGIAQMQEDLGGIPEELRAIQVDYNGISLPSLFATAGEVAGGIFVLPVNLCKLSKGSKPQVFEETYPTSDDKGWSSPLGKGIRIWKGVVTTVKNPWYNIQAGWKVTILLVDANRDRLPIMLHPRITQPSDWEQYKDAAADVANVVASGDLVKSFLA